MILQNSWKSFFIWSSQTSVDAVALYFLPETFISSGHILFSSVINATINLLPLTLCVVSEVHQPSRKCLSDGRQLQLLASMLYSVKCRTLWGDPGNTIIQQLFLAGIDCMSTRSTSPPEPRHFDFIVFTLTPFLVGNFHFLSHSVQRLGLV